MVAQPVVRPRPFRAMLGLLRGAFNRLRDRPAAVIETGVSDEDARDLVQWFQEQYSLEDLVGEETKGWGEEMLTMKTI